MWSASARPRKHSASARMSRPSASVFSTSIVLPLRAVSTSPSFIALPLGMFSTSASTPSTFTGSFSSAMACIAAEDGRGAGHVALHVHHLSVVLSDSPPLSNVTPLPTSAERRPAGVAGVAQDRQPRRPVRARARRRAASPSAPPRAATRPTLRRRSRRRAPCSAAAAANVSGYRSHGGTFTSSRASHSAAGLGPHAGRTRSGRTAVAGRARTSARGRTASASSCGCPGPTTPLREPDADGCERVDSAAPARANASVPTLLAGDVPRRGGARRRGA